MDDVEMTDASSPAAVTASESLAKGMNDEESNKEQKDGEMKSAGGTGGNGSSGDVPTESAAAAAAAATATATATATDEEAMTTTTTTMIDSMMPQSQLPQLLSYFLHKLDRIDELERRIIERTRKSRRRILNGLEQRQVWQKYRRSHVRLFVTHHFQRKTGIWTLVLEGKLLIGNLDHQNANLVDTEGVMTQRASSSSSSSQEESSNDENNKSGDDGPPASKKAKTEDGDKEGSEKSSSTTLTPYTVAAKEAMARHSQSIEEEPTNIEPLLFTHMFQKFEVTFRTIYQPKTAANTPEEPRKTLSKKERKKQKLNKMMGVQDGVNPKDLRASEPIKVEWFRSGQPPPPPPQDETKEESDPKTRSLTNNQPKTPDAHSFFVKYNNHFSERPPPPNMKFFSVVADIKLYPKRPSPDDDTEAFYQVSKTLAEKFFPYHSTEGATQRNEKSEDLPGEATSVDPHQRGKQPGLGSAETAKPIPLENAIHVPALLTYNEIAAAIFQYIQDHKLHDAEDKSYIQCDKVLQDIFEVEGMSFSQLKQILTEKRLIKAVQPFEEPVVLTYIMNESSTSKFIPDGFEEVVPSSSTPPTAAAAAAAHPPPQQEAPTTATNSDDQSPSTEEKGASAEDPARAPTPASSAAAPAADEEPEGEHPTVISFDMDVSIPSMYNSRARDLLRRGKCRELDYVSARTKARQMLSSSKASEGALRIKMDQCISRQGYTGDENVPIFLAIAKAAPPNSEARTAAQIDARTCDLVGRIEESGRLADTAWEAVENTKVGLTIPITAMKTKEESTKYDETKTDQTAEEDDDGIQTDEKGDDGEVEKQVDDMDES
mmetsp:Transcript_43233/g.104700  ORF Transcript_43233/g.104700 Transcript_43233/m.104700 type:complete len:829 (+) Transcript_43233:83-2569(+)